MALNVACIISEIDRENFIGPMSTSEMVSEYLLDNGCINNIYKIVLQKNIESPSGNEFYINDKSILKKTINKELNCWLADIYKKYDLVIVLWYPKLCFNLSIKQVKKSKFIMMDSQYELIKSTLKFDKLFFSNILKMYMYLFIEFLYSRFSNGMYFVSNRDIKFKNSKKINLPLKYEESFKRKIKPIILIPRPDKKLFLKFMEHLPDNYHVKVLLNDELNFQRQNFSHFKFVKNYSSFYEEGCVVILLDKGGAGVANRILKVSEFGYPFFCTNDSMRGHNVHFENCFGKIDDMKTLSNKVVKFMADEKKWKNCDNKKVLSNYLFPNCIEILIDDLQ